MLRSLKDLHGSTINATDGEVGTLDQFVFDDQHWTIRYFVVNTGGWLTGRSVLISPRSIANVAWDSHTVDVNLTRHKIENAPDVSTHLTVSREKEEQFARYYAHEPYWYGPGAWGAGIYPQATAVGVSPRALAQAGDEPAHSDEQEASAGENHLRSTEEVTGYRIKATDDEIGHVEDFVMDDATWQIRYMVVNTSNWWFGKSVLVAPQWITAIDWAAAQVEVNLTRDAIQDGPEFDAATLDRAYEERLYRHYGQRGYWEQPR